MATYYEKSRTVFWALTPSGMILHNFATRQFCELDDIQTHVWGYLDGVHSLNDICRIVVKQFATIQTSDVDHIVQDIIEDLFAAGFIVVSSP